ncbi:hypothetical protein G9A89_003540 [Geosiphon pyriformis]|nr:hypothetical protein G9A89_003540 [Geosiphon pyriformis]
MKLDGEINLDEYGVSKILELIVAAEELILENLINHLEDYLIEHHAKELKENFLTLRETSYKYPSFKKLQDFFAKIAVRNSVAVFNSQDFTSLDQCALVSFLQRDLFDLQEAEIWEKPLRRIRFFHISSVDFYYKVKPFEKTLPGTLYEDLLQHYLVPGSRQIFQDKDENTPFEDQLRNDFKLLLQGSRNGFIPTDFHRLCDNKGATITHNRGTLGLIGWMEKEVLFFSLEMAKLKMLNLANLFPRMDLLIARNGGPKFGEVSIVMKSEDFQNKPGCSCGKDTCYEHAIMPNSENEQVNFLVEEYEVFQIRKHET